MVGIYFFPTLQPHGMKNKYFRYSIIYCVSYTVCLTWRKAVWSVWSHFRYLSHRRQDWMEGDCEKLLVTFFWG